MSSETRGSPGTTPLVEDESSPPSASQITGNQTSHVSNSRNPLEDPADPYYLHHADNPGNILVSQPLTGQENYASWSRAMRLSISIKNKLGFLDGSIPKPSLSDSVLYNAWIGNNNIVISWILNSVSKEIFASNLYNESAAVIWTNLRVRFHQKNGQHIFNLIKELMNLKQDVLSINMYYTKL
ncbi:uncharacterized protein LOC133806326 [Humulus lupulus]|uniref:uncharacterized protein LOC133806326 n=1 Tax=Humulus lupulus TaxID=3486 RepID=UPI002B407E7E|nr:uncharacterized protein LOC133806326 [Humulus lupulus]